MNEAYKILNSRELAYAIWIIIVFIILVSYSKTRSAILALLSTLFVKKILKVYLIAILYITLWIIILYNIGYWNKDLFKPTLFWFLFVASILIHKTIRTSNKKGYFINIIKDNIKLSIIFEFLAGLQTLNIWFEVIIIPILFLIGTVIALTENKNNLYLRRAANIIYYSIVFILFFSTLYLLFINYKEVLKLATLYEFILSPILCIVFVPFLLGLALYTNYEIAFTILNRLIKAKSLLTYTKKQALLKFNIDLDGMTRWRSYLFLKEVRTKEDVDKSIELIKHLQRIEKSPPKVLISEGWSPYLAKDFLLEQGIITQYCNYCYEETWQASSRSLKLDKEMFPNTISYFVTGNQNYGRKLKLLLDINSLKTQSIALLKLLESSSLLYSKSLNENIPSKIKDAILLGHNIKVDKGVAEISVNKNEWNSPNGGFSISFEIKHCLWVESYIAEPIT